MTLTSHFVCAVCLATSGLYQVSAADDSVVTHITTNEAGTDPSEVKVSSHGIDLSGRPSLSFKLKTCDTATLRLLPRSLNTGSTLYNIELNKVTDDHANFGAARICMVMENGKPYCGDPAHAYMNSTCEGYRVFWIRFSETGLAEFGAGCGDGSGTMFSHTDAFPFVLDDVSVSSVTTADWVFEPFKVTTTGNTKVKVSEHGMDVSGLKTLTFQLMTCERATIRSFPRDLTKGTTGYKVGLNKKNQDLGVYSAQRVCWVNEDEGLNCEEPSYVSMKSTCEEYRSFWIRFSESGQAEFGAGEEVGSGTIFSHMDDIPFVLGDISVSSQNDANWLFGSSVCMNTLASEDMSSEETEVEASEETDSGSESEDDVLEEDTGKDTEDDDIVIEEDDSGSSAKEEEQLAEDKKSAEEEVKDGWTVKDEAEDGEADKDKATNTGSDLVEGAAENVEDQDMDQEGQKDKFSLSSLIDGFLDNSSTPLQSQCFSLVFALVLHAVWNFIPVSC